MDRARIDMTLVKKTVDEWLNDIDYDDDTVNQFMEADFRRNKRTISLSFEYKFGEFKKKKYIREDSHDHDHGGEGGMDVGF